MLKIMQENLKRKTEEFKKVNIKKTTKGFDPVQQMILKRLSAEQGNLADMTQEFTKKIEQMQKQMPKMKEGGE